MISVQAVRYPVFGLLILFSFIVLGLDGHIANKSSGTVLGIHISPPSWASLGIAVAVLSLISIIAIVVLDYLEKNSISSLVAVELGWFGFLWVLWLAAAGDIASAVSDCGDTPSADDFGGFGGGFGFRKRSIVKRSFGSITCGEAQAATAFSFLAFFLLFAYWVWVLVSCIMAHNKGNTSIWLSTVPEADFQGSGGEKGYGAGYPTQVQPGSSYAGAPTPQQHTQYPPNTAPVSAPQYGSPA